MEPANLAVRTEAPAARGRNPLRALHERGWVYVAIALATLDIVVWLMGWRIFNPDPGTDYRIHVAAAARWLELGSPYYPLQLAGPYQLAATEPPAILYPPTIFPLFAAFTVLPAALWWGIPIAITLVVIAMHRPSRSRLVVILLLLAWPQSVIVFAVGNPVMWIVAGLALGTVYPAFSPLVLLKPSLFPLALWGANRRAWWLGLALLLLMSIPFGSLWMQWLTALFNARQSQGIFYSAYQVPLLLIPLVASVRWPDVAVLRRHHSSAADTMSATAPKPGISVQSTSAATGVNTGSASEL
jgi:hypothetical protein